MNHTDIYVRYIPLAYRIFHQSEERKISGFQAAVVAVCLKQLYKARSFLVDNMPGQSTHHKRKYCMKSAHAEQN